MRLTDNVIDDLGVDDDAAYLFWTVVQAVRDYVFYNPTGAYRHLTYHRLAKKWILNPDYRVEWGDHEEAISFTFSEALEMLGIHSENVDIIRKTIRDAYYAKTDEERKAAVMRAYGELHFHDNELDPWRCLNGIEQVPCF